MKLLFDENLSPKLSSTLQDLYADSRHVEECGLGAADDTSIWTYARNYDFTIVSKDSDFYQHSVVIGAPPKVIWLQLGNCTTAQIEETLRRFATRIQEFAALSEETCLAVTARRVSKA